MQTTHVVFNPASGSYSNSIKDAILDALRSAGTNPSPILPSSAEETETSVTNICKQFANPIIVAVGGDGTINTVINGMLQDSATLGIIPLGTANVMAKELGISSVYDAISRIAAGAVRPFSVGEASSAAGTRRFALMVGIGADAAAVADIRPGEKRLLGKGAYVLAGLRCCINWDSRLIKVSSGGHDLCCNSMIITNVAHYAGPYKLAPQASLFDPRLVIVPLPFSGPLGMLRFTASVFLRGRYDASDIFQSEQDSIIISCDKPVQLDGDPFGTGPLIIKIIPGFNHLIV